MILNEIQSLRIINIELQFVLVEEKLKTLIKKEGNSKNKYF